MVTCMGHKLVSISTVIKSVSELSNDLCFILCFIPIADPSCMFSVYSLFYKLCNQGFLPLRNFLIHGCLEAEYQDHFQGNKVAEMFY